MTAGTNFALGAGFDELATRIAAVFLGLYLGGDDASAHVVGTLDGFSHAVFFPPTACL